MDLLGSILNSMDKPPSFSNKQRSLMKKHKEEILKKQREEKEKLKAFRETIEENINKFLQDESLQKHKFEPMEQVYRSIVRDVAEVAGVPAFSIGEEGIDRHVMIFKPEFAPSDDELAALRRGEEWDPEKAKLLAQKQELERKEEEERALKTPKDFVPSSNYRAKYEHLIGREAAKEAARKTQTNKQYGFGMFLKNISAFRAPQL
ncbi:hypothetical protein B7P43_G12613 [Cryptotermes secundus]|uniref:R3H domain-containing protein n=1 Tax=Cryptotermes secundus TaxID=105785 RepID=A0A2J7QKI7_9NEOP|nr:hypothetical protein B7P43_G12613 [Cryptotermes secundus]